MLIPGSEPPHGINPLARTMLLPSPLADVAAAVAAATLHWKLVYVERVGDAWRWSLAGPGGFYPMLRRTASFLGVDHRRLVIAFKTLDDGNCVLADPARVVEPKDWALITFDGSASPGDVETRIRAAFATR
jgi:hypothetical protein